MTVRYAEPKAMIAWAESLTGGRYREDAQAIGVEHRGELRAVAVFDTFSRRNVHLSIVSERGRMWLTKEFARAVACYAFLTAKYPRLTCQIPEDNAAAATLACQMGCQLEGRLREAGPGGVDVLVFGLLKRDCVWLPKGLELSRHLGQRSV